MVSVLVIISDLFYFNKSRDYIRLADSTNNDIVMDIVWYCMIASIYLGIPCVIYSLVLEWRRRKRKKYFPASLVFGLCFGACVGYLFIQPLEKFSIYNVLEASVQVLGVLLVVGILVPLLLKAVPMRQNSSAEIVDDQPPDAPQPPN